MSENVDALLSELTERGIILSLADGRLRYKAPKGVIDSELMSRLAKHKSALTKIFEDRLSHLQTPFPVVAQPRVNGKRWPLSYSQQRLYFLEQLEPGLATYNLPFSFRIMGAWNTDAFEKALREIVIRHESLRTYFVAEDGVPSQLIAPRADVTLEHVDLSGLSPELRDLELDRIAERSACKPFNLQHPPLLRATLIRMAFDEYRLYFTMHHIIGDGWSLSILVREIAEMYEAQLQQRPYRLNSLGVQYVDYATWQREHRQISDVFEPQLTYWKERLSGVERLELPTLPSTGGERNTTLVHGFTLSSELVGGLDEVGRKCGATLFMVLLAAFQLLLSHCCGQEDVVVGSAVANRSRLDLEGLVGLFVNVVAMRTNAGGDPLFQELLSQVRNVALDAFANQDVPFEMVVEKLRPQRDVDNSPLFRVLFVLQNISGLSIELAGVKIEQQYNHRGLDPYDLTLMIWQGKEGVWEATFKYRAELFDSQTVKILAEDFCELLAAIVVDPGRKVSQILAHCPSSRIRIASPEEVPIPMGASFVPFEPEEIEQSIPARFYAVAQRFASRMAICTPKRSWTYAELLQDSRYVSRIMISNIGPSKERVALLFDHDASMLIAMLGSLMANMTYLPLDPGYPQGRLQYMLADVKAVAIITNDSNFELASELAGASLPVINLDRAIIGVFDQLHESSVGPEDTACIVYSSGSMGTPKGTVQTHRSILHVVANYANVLRLNCDDRCTVMSSYSHVMAMIDIYATVLNGATLYPVNIKREGITDLSTYIHNQRITIYRSAPSLFRLLAGNLKSDEDFSLLRAVVLGAEPIQMDDHKLYQRLCSPNCVFVNTYGSTEATVSMMNVMNASSMLSSGPIPIGYPVGANRIVLLGETGRPSLFRGEITIRSKYIAGAYWSSSVPDSTTFFPDPLVEGEWVYRTGDIGRRTVDGQLILVGRKDNQVKLRGFRIELEEVEAAINEQSSVDRAAVFVAHNRNTEPRLEAYVVSRVGCSISKTELLIHLRERLPEYMVPSGFSVVDSLPLTPNGKLDRQALRTISPIEVPAENLSLAPQTALEEIVGGMWCGILGIDKVQREGNFFDIGGHSLLAARLVSQLKKSLTIDVPLRAVFEFPTLKAFCEKVQEMLVNSKPLAPIPRVGHDGPMRVSSAQERLLLLEQLDQTGAYSLPFALVLRGRLDQKAFARAVQELFTRHEALRTHFEWRDGVPVQIVDAKVLFDLPTPQKLEFGKNAQILDKNECS